MGTDQYRLIISTCAKSEKLVNSYHNDPHFRAACELASKGESNEELIELLLTSLSDVGLTIQSLQAEVVHCKTVHPPKPFINDV